jgi:hypothetical protein
MVVHKPKHPIEREVIAGHGVRVHQLADVLEELRTGNDSAVPNAAEADFVDLVFVSQRDGAGCSIRAAPASV